MTYYVFKNGVFNGIFQFQKVLEYIHQGSRSLTVAQAIAEGWEITTKPRQ